MKSLCECNYNNFKNIIFDNEILAQSQLGQINEIISNSNVAVLKCYKDIFELKYFISCIGGFIILAFIFMHIILTIVYSCKGFFAIRKYIFTIANKFMWFISLHNYNINLPNKIDNEKIAPPKKIERARKTKSKTAITGKTKHNIIINNNNIFNINNNINGFKKNTQMYKLIASNANHYNKNSKKEVKQYRSETKLKYKTDIHKIHKSEKNHSEKSLNLSKDPFVKCKSSEKDYIKNDDLLINLKDIEIDINLKEYLSTQIEDMDYDDAIKKDKRTLCNYFYDKVKQNQMILNTFCYIEPLKPKWIKMMLLILQIDLYFYVNGLFFNEEYASLLFHLEKDTFYNKMERFLNNFFYSAFVGGIISYIIDFFFVEEKKIRGILKRERNNFFILKYEIVQLTQNIKKRYIYFIVLTFLILIFSWYHISCFNNIYPHMKKEWLIFSIIIIFLMQILSILASLLESILRSISFKCKSEKIYKFSLLLA